RRAVRRDRARDTPRRPATVPECGRSAACSRRLACDVPIAGRFHARNDLRAEKRPGNGSLRLTRFRGQVDVFAREALRVAAPQTYWNGRPPFLRGALGDRV